MLDDDRELVRWVMASVLEVRRLVAIHGGNHHDHAWKAFRQWVETGANVFCPDDDTLHALGATEPVDDAVPLPFPQMLIVLPERLRDGSTAAAMFLWQTPDGKRHLAGYSDRQGGGHEVIRDLPGSAGGSFLALSPTTRRALLNFGAWLAVKPPTREPAPPRRLAVTRRQRLEARQAPTVWRHERIVIPEGLLQTAQRSEAEYAATGREIHARHWVRGHFKRQAHGPRRSQRVLMWIAPYERGPDSPEVQAHVYETLSW